MLLGSAFASLFEFCVATVCITKEGPKPLFCYAGNNAFGARTCPLAGGAVPRENTTLWCFLTRGLQVLF